MTTATLPPAQLFADRIASAINTTLDELGRDETSGEPVAQALCALLVTLISKQPDPGGCFLQCMTMIATAAPTVELRITRVGTQINNEVQ